MRNAEQVGVIVLMNAMENPTEAVDGIYAVLDKRKGYEFKNLAPTSGLDLEAYSGHYSERPWGSEAVIAPWAGGLALLGLPSDKPAEAMVFLKPAGGNVFRRVRDDGNEAEEFQFQRDASGKVTGFVHFSNPMVRVSEKQEVSGDSIHCRIGLPAASRKLSTLKGCRQRFRHRPCLHPQKNGRVSSLW
jgi:hypothetical protein